MNEVKVSALIDRVISIAKQNNDEELLKWARLESLGYNTSNKYMTDDEEVPEYREIHVEHQDQYDKPIIFTHPDMKDINISRIRHSVIELEDFSTRNCLLKIRDSFIIGIIQKHFNFPASHYVFDSNSLKAILHSIKLEALERIEKYVNTDEIMSESYRINNSLENNSVSNSVFVSYSFKDNEFVKGLIELLKSSGFNIMTGEKNPIGSISRSILSKIQKAEKFVVIMTKRDKKENGKYTTSSWLLEEKGVAIAYGKPCIIFVEEEIDDNEIGGMQGDDQRLHFTRNNFTSKVADAIIMLKGEVQ